ncbi:amidohydrolase family protein [Saccharomonospora xinjiangensis]|uniref:Putative TIM-barrel fold metal-dependent hydrolase n=1 Tax=Saccharomonospora xinjiangensis XJ-54 TaxID=882086 RepID=I0V787_9PSEU|nr:amidohydrolase family protein [Saccharomonospora xinjiangensis]EID55990.1 putative TIM-barrel fold metal-dependent hydrolase [Saccharomonospora xinjiangensis XJ-54]
MPDSVTEAADVVDVVDAWMQQPNDRFMRQPWLETLVRWTGMDRHAPPVRDTIAAMDRAGVSCGLLSAWHGPTGPLISNDEVAAVVASHPDRFRGVAAVDLTDPMGAVREIRRCVRELGFVAVRVVPWLWNLPPNDRRYYPVYVACAELGVPFCTQIGHTGPLCPSEPGRPIPYLDEVLLDFPELVVVGGHVGYPWIHEVLSLATKYPNFYIDTSAYAVHRLPAELVEFLRGRGRERVLFGSNYPMITAADCLRRLDELGLDDEAKGLFLSGNARRVFALSG